MVGLSTPVRSLVILANFVDAHLIQAGKTQYAYHIYSWNNLDGLPQGGEETWEEIWPTENLNTTTYGVAYADPFMPLSRRNLTFLSLQSPKGAQVD